MALSALLLPPAAAQTVPQDSVAGSGTSGDSAINALSFQIDARSGPSGENPTGSARFVPLLFPEFGGPITCLSVKGNVATFTFFIGSASFVTAQATDSPAGDLIRVAGLSGANGCTTLTVTGGSPLTSGDLVVVDAQPLPISKDQCKNGGWRNYGVFKNQGDCVSFVATKGKNPPGGKTG
jgi:hypothetical protein